MQLDFKTVTLNKRFALAISRGVFTSQDNLFVTVSSDGFTGIGEMSPGESEGAASVEIGQQALDAFWQPDWSSVSVQHIYRAAREAQLPLCALAALDMALWDWLGKRAGMPLYQLLGLSQPTVPTSITLGINPPEVVRERIPLLLDGTGLRSLKVKLGSPDGVEADQAMFDAVVEQTRRRDVALRVDANGGWDLATARKMMQWLSDRNVEYIEQPLAKGNEDALIDLYKDRSMPIYIDESCTTSSDIPRLADRIDGVNLKLMKCGGITEALRIIAVARACGLKTMIGCMSESSVAISAGAAITSLMDHVDLDSHLNLNPDPATGAQLVDGIITPTSEAGHGASLTHA